MPRTNDPMFIRKLTRTAIAALLAAVSLCGASCNELVEKITGTQPSDPTSIQGVWEITSIQSSEAAIRVRVGDGNDWINSSMPAQETKVLKDSPLYSIIKVSEEDICILAGPGYFEGTLTGCYPYTLRDTVIQSEALPRKYDQNIYSIHLYQKGKVLVLRQLTSGYNATRDTICLGREILTYMGRLR